MRFTRENTPPSTELDVGSEKKKNTHISEIPSLISFLLSNFQDMRSVAMALCGKIEQRKENTYTLKEVSLSGASWSFRSCVTVLAW